ncbi:MAG: hypothetical protein RL272_947 [Candidatus Parcubacteria bacterium]|jgi:hypothetical protein
MGKAFLASLFVLCMNFLILIEVLPFRAAGCILTLSLAGVATTTVYYLALREFGIAPAAARTDAVAFAVVVVLFYSYGVGTLISCLLHDAAPASIATRCLFFLTFMTAWGFFREAKKSRA